MKHFHFVFRLLLDWLLAVAGVLGALFCVITSFHLPVPDGLVPTVLLASLLFCVLLSEKQLRRFSLPALLLCFGLLCWGFHETLSESFRQLWGELISHFALGYDQLLDLAPREKPDITATGPALLCLGLAMAFAVCCAVRWWKRSFPAALFMAPGIVPCFILLNTPPALPPLMAAAASILTQVFSQPVRRREAGEECKAICLSAVLSVGLLGLLLLLFPRESYRPPISWSQLSEKMERWGREQSNRGNQLAGLSGDPDQVDLGELGALPNHPSTALRVRAEQSDSLYLRGSAYSVFDGAVWSRGAELNWPITNLFPYLNEDGGYWLEIITEDPEPVLYTTYQLTVLPQRGLVVSDNRISNPYDVTRYQLRYLPTLAARPPDEDYDAWVRDSCTKLPEQTRRGVLSWWADHGGALPTVHSGPQLEQFAQRAADTVSECAAYSRNPIQAPEETDFCTWFLNEAEEGYCVHYATACTALLRAMGIPARYVTGFVCRTVAGEIVAVTNLQAHAWVEIWNDGRWVPVEPTPDEATEFEGLVMGGMELPESTEITEPETESEIPIESRLPEPPEEIPTRPRPTETPVETTRPIGGGQPDEPAPPKDLTPLWILLGVIGLLDLVLVRRILAQRFRERKLARASVNDRARLLYRYIRRLHGLGGGSIPEEAVRLAYKAGFSQHELSEEELAFLRQLYDQQTNRLRTAYLRRRIYCKYIRAVV